MRIFDRGFDLILGLRGYQGKLPWGHGVWVKLWRTNRCLLSKVTWGWRAFRVEGPTFTKPPGGAGVGSKEAWLLWGTEIKCGQSTESERRWVQGQVRGVGKGRPVQPWQGILYLLEEFFGGLLVVVVVVRWLNLHYEQITLLDGTLDGFWESENEDQKRNITVIGYLFSFSQLNGNLEIDPMPCCLVPPESSPLSVPTVSVLLGPPGHSADVVAQSTGIWHFSIFPEKGLEVSCLSLVNMWQQQSTL